MSQCPPELIVSSSYLLRKWCPELITEILDQLTPSNLILHQVSKSYAEAAQLHEKWYDTAYSEERLTEANVNAWTHATRDGTLAGIHLPKPNAFIAEDFGIYASGEAEVCFCFAFGVCVGVFVVGI